VLAIVALWVLARIRFPDQPATPNPIPTLLSQLSPTPRFENLAGELAELQKRLADSWLVILASARPDENGEPSALALPALRLRSDAALVLLVGGARLQDQEIIAADRVTGLAVVRAGTGPSGPGLSPWSPPSLDSPRYLMATAATPAGIALRPVLVPSLFQTRSPAWSGPIWAVPEGTDLDAGSFVFTTAGELAGLVVSEPFGPAIVPGDVVTTDAARLLERGPTASEDLRIEVQPLTPALAKVTGVSAGVVVAWVDPKGPAAPHLMPGDVIETFNGEPLRSVRDWDVQASRFSTGSVNLLVRRRGEQLDVRLTPTALRPPPSSSLGLTLSSLPGVGAAVVRVDVGSAAHAAGLREGDVITLAGSLRASTPADIRAAFESTRPGDGILLALTRGSTHRVLAVTK